MSAVMPFFYTVDSVLFPILTGLINHSPIGFIIKRSKGCGLSVSRHGIFNVVKGYNAAPTVENQARISCDHKLRLDFFISCFRHFSGICPIFAAGKTGKC